MVADQEKIVRQNIFKQLKEITEKGRLNTYNSDVLLLEQLSTILYFYSKKLGYNFEIKDYYLPRFNLIYPIDLISLKDRIYKFRVAEYYNRQHSDQQIIDEKIQETLRENLDIPKLNITGDFPPFEELATIIEILLEKGYSTITEHHLPCPDISISDAKMLYPRDRNLTISEIRVMQFSDSQAYKYIEAFFKHFEDCYKAFVDDCFPTFKERFPFFLTLPHEYFVYLKDSNDFKWGLLAYRQSKDGQVRINFGKLRSPDEPSIKREVDVMRSFSLDYILHNHSHANFLMKTIDKFNTPKVDEFCVLRNWVYKFLKEDIKELFKENEE